MACAWMYVYPYLSGELNFTVSGLGYGMKSRHVLPEGLFLITIPFDLIPDLIKNLQDMDWAPHWFSLGRDRFIEAVQKLEEEMRQEFPTD